MSLKSQNPHNTPFKYQPKQELKQQGMGMYDQNDNIFKTQPNIPSYDNRSYSVNQRSANNLEYVKKESYKPKINNNYARSLPRVSETEYKNPSTRLDDGLYKKLYSVPKKDLLDYQKSPRNTNLKPYLANNVEKNNSMPFYLNKDEVSIFDDAKFKNFLHKYEAKINNPSQDKKVHFEPLQSTQREQDSSILTKRAPQYSKSFYDLQASSASLDTSSQFNNSRINASYLQGSSTDASPKTTVTNEWDSAHSSQVQGKYHVADEIISSRSNFSKAPYWPRMEDSSKMRNPIYASHDFSNYKKSPATYSKPNLNNSYSYSNLNPVSPKEYLKTQKAALAQVGSETPVVHHSFKIDSALGMIPITNEEKRSMTNNALKSFLSADSHRNLTPNNSYTKVELNVPYPTSETKLVNGVKTIDQNYSYTPKSNERRNSEKPNPIQGSIMIQDESQNNNRRDLGNSNSSMRFEKSLFGRMTGKPLSLNSSPLLKGGLTGKGARGFGVFGPNAEHKIDVSPPW